MHQEASLATPRQARASQRFVTAWRYKRHPGQNALHGGPAQACGPSSQSLRPASQQRHTITSTTHPLPHPRSHLFSPAPPFHPGRNHSSFALPPSALAVFLASPSTSRASLPPGRPPKEAKQLLFSPLAWRSLALDCRSWLSPRRRPPHPVPASASAYSLSGSLPAYRANSSFVPAGAHLQPVRAGLVLPRANQYPRKHLQPVS